MGNVAWERLTVGTLRAILDEMQAAGTIDDETLICADSDPEGNDLNPLRRAVSNGVYDRALEDHWEDSEEKPVRAICFGVGY